MAKYFLMLTIVGNTADKWKELLNETSKEKNFFPKNLFESFLNFLSYKWDPSMTINYMK